MTIGVIVVRDYTHSVKKQVKQKETGGSSMIKRMNPGAEWDRSLKLIWLQQQDMSQNTVNPLLHRVNSGDWIP